MVDLVEQTRQSLIAQHGERSLKFENGYKIIKTNAYLDAFERFTKSLFNFSQALNFSLDNYSREIAAIFNFCEDCESDEMNAMAKILENRTSILKPNNARIYNKKLSTFLADVKEILSQQVAINARIGVAFSNNFGNIYRVTSKYEQERGKLIASHYCKQN